MKFKTREDLTPEAKENLKKNLIDIINRVINDGHNMILVAEISNKDSVVMAQGENEELSNMIVGSIVKVPHLREVFQLAIDVYNYTSEKEPPHDCDKCEMSGKCPIESLMRVVNSKENESKINLNSIKPKGEC